MSRINSRLPLISILITVIIILSFLSLLIGPEKIPATKVIASVFLPGGSTASSIIWQARIPRLIQTMLAGASLAAAGTLFLGLYGHYAYYSIVPFVTFGAGAVLAAVSVVMMAFGIMLDSRVYVLLGTLIGTTWGSVFMLVPFVILGILTALFYSKDLNGLVFGEYTAKTIGIEVAWVRALLTAIAILLSLASMTVCGLSGLVWLLIPFFVKFAAGTNYKYLIPVSMLGGVAVFVLVDIFSRLVFPAELPLGIILSLVGCPLFLYAVHRRKVGL